MEPHWSVPRSSTDQAALFCPTQSSSFAEARSSRWVRAPTSTFPRRTVEVDATGRWIIPGLIDSHAHVARWALSRYLAWGVTTVRDVHGTLDSILALRKEVNGGTTIGPRIYTAGAMIDGVPTTYSDALPAPNEQAARKQVDRLVNAGVDLIKVYSHVDPPLLRAIIDEARPSTYRSPATWA